jgi:hypothetical protein
VKLRAALIGPCRPWEELLMQEGFPWRVVDAREITPGEYSVAIVHRKPEPPEQDSLERYLRQGGAVIGDGMHSGGVCAAAARSEFIEYLVGEGRFRNVHLVDLGLAGRIPLEATECRTQQGAHAIFAGELCGGLAVLFPFSPAAAMADERSTVKAFYARRDRLPAERVSLVAKGEVRHLVHEALEFLHVERGIPYAHLWYFPDRCENVFAFRVDTDGAGREDVERLYRVARASGTPMSWFLDVRTSEPHLERFHAMVEQEIGIHCYDHREPAGEAALREDLRKGMGVLTGAGFRPEGFAATYGFWKPFVSAVPREFGLRYSSEFSCAYDTVPYVPTSLTAVHGVMQVPVHPVCPGTLRQAGYLPLGMTEYYRGVVATKRARREPLIFYHHPSHRAWDVIETLCQEGLHPGTRRMTLGEYAAWWGRKRPIALRLREEGEELLADPATVLQCAEQGVSIRIARRGEEECVIPLAERIGLRFLPWREIPRAPAPADLRRVREFDLRSMLGTLVNSMIRRTR